MSESEELSNIVLEQARRLFAGVAGSERLAEADRGEWPAAVWEAVEQAGLPLALVPESQGGVGLAAADGLALIRLAGYHGLPVPLPETMIAAALWARASGAGVSGILSLAPVATDDDIRVERSTGGYALQGRARRVPWGARAQHTLLHARDRTGAGYFVLLPQGAAKLEAHRNLAFEPRDTIHLDGVVLPTSAVRAAQRDCAEGLLAFGALIRVQQMVGAMERVVDHSVRYATERKQFGRPIGKFQAVQMMVAEAAGQYAAAAAAADLAVEAFGRGEVGFAVAVAKARVGEAAGKVAEVGHQVHGAMGFTQEHPLHFSTRRLWSWRDEFGHEPFWQERIGRLVCSRGGEALWPMLTEETGTSHRQGAKESRQQAAKTPRRRGKQE